MAQVQLNDKIFKAAERRAVNGGYSSVDAYIADVVVQHLAEELENFDHVFTPERVVELRQISADIKAGGTTYTIAEVQEHFENRRKSWLAKHAI